MTRMAIAVPAAAEAVGNQMTEMHFENPGELSVEGVGIVVLEGKEPT